MNYPEAEPRGILLNKYDLRTFGIGFNKKYCKHIQNYNN